MLDPKLNFHENSIESYSFLFAGQRNTASAKGKDEECFLILN